LPERILPSERLSFSRISIARRIASFSFAYCRPKLLHLDVSGGLEIMTSADRRSLALQS
jgi:hypothetical protein